MSSNREKNEARKVKRDGRREVKSKSQDCCVTFKPKNSKFCFLRMPKLCKLISCIWIRRLWSVCPVNGSVVSFSTTVTRKLLDYLKTCFTAKPPGASGLRLKVACTFPKQTECPSKTTCLQKCVATSKLHVHYSTQGWYGRPQMWFWD